MFPLQDELVVASRLFIQCERDLSVPIRRAES